MWILRTAAPVIHLSMRLYAGKDVMQNRPWSGCCIKPEEVILSLQGFVRLCVWSQPATWIRVEGFCVGSARVSAITLRVLLGVQTIRNSALLISLRKLIPAVPVAAYPGRKASVCHANTQSRSKVPSLDFLIPNTQTKRCLASLQQSSCTSSDSVSVSSIFHV